MDFVSFKYPGIDRHIRPGDLLIFNRFEKQEMDTKISGTIYYKKWVGIISKVKRSLFIVFIPFENKYIKVRSIDLKEVKPSMDDTRKYPPDYLIKKLNEQIN